jgi:hypothetical protein
LFENERAPAPHLTKLNKAVREADEKVVAFPGPVLATSEGGVRARAWGGSTWAAAGLVAAAACVALVVMRQAPIANVVDTASPATEVATVQRPTVTGAREEPVAIPQTVASPRSNYAPVLVANTLLRGHGSNSETAPLSFASEGAALEWMNRVQLSPLQSVSAEDLMFEGRSLQSPESRTYRGRNPYAADAEMTAFQFQR